MIRILCNQGYFISFSVYNNVIWALGEMVMRCQSTQVQGYLSSLLKVLVPLFTHPTVPASIHENVMIALGRLSLVCPDLLAPTLSLFIQPCLKTSLSVREGEEKESAFRGLCAIIKLNAQDAHQVSFFFFFGYSIFRNLTFYVAFTFVIGCYRYLGKTF